MNRKSLIGRFAPQFLGNQSAESVVCFRAHLEVLEERKLLSVNDLLIADYDGTGGLSVRRYNEITMQPGPGTVAHLNPSEGNIDTPQGLAVAPDGSFYVSNSNTAVVDHFSNAGLLLGTVGAGSLFAPASLLFGPNGHLYVADQGAQGIFEFDTSAPNTPVGFTSLGYIPAGFNFEADGTNDLVVGGLFNMTVTRYDHVTQAPTVLVAPGQDINPSAILPKGTNGDLLIADFDLGFDPTNHHRVVQYTHGNPNVSTVVNLTQPIGTGMFAGLPPQPTSLLYDHDGNLLIGLSPDHSGDGAIEKYNFTTTQLTTLENGIGTPSGMAFIPQMRSDILMSNYDDSTTNNTAVQRFDPGTYADLNGEVPAKDMSQGNIDTPQGVAVAPDGTFYVSNPNTGFVDHFSAAGQYIDNLGSGTLFAAASLQFGPNGHLYVADWASQGIYEFDTASPNTPVSFQSLGYLAAGFTFVPASPTPDLIVGGLFTQTVTQYHSDGSMPTVLISPTSNINPSAILREANGKLLIADFDLGFDPTNHHEIIECNADGSGITQVVNIGAPFGTGMFAGLPSQPTSMMYDHDGNLLIGVSPDHSGDGAIEKYDFTAHTLTTLKSNLGTPSGLAFIPAESTVTARDLFYHNSTRYDQPGGTNPQTPLPFSDDNAIASDKTAYLPNGTAATFANVSSFDKGINGIMVDLLGGGTHSSITQANILNDFIFKVGNNNSPSTWTAAPTPTTVTVRTGAGVAGADRVELIWADNAIQEKWLEVTVKSTSNTGLAANDVFFFGNAVGDSGAGDTATLAETTAVDEVGARNNSQTLLNNIPLTNVFDYNRDGAVSAIDQVLARNNAQTLGATRYIKIAAGGPFAPEPAASGDAGIASALASSASVSSTTPPVRFAILNAPAHRELYQSPIAKYFELLAQAGAVKAKAMLTDAHPLGLDDELLDSLLVGLSR